MNHKHGLTSDLNTIIARRKVLGLIGTAVSLTACGGPPSNAEANKTATAADGSTCIKDPIETNGPYPADGTNSKNGSAVNVLTQSGIMRRDIRPSFGDGMTAVADGVLLQLTISLVDVGKECAALAGHVVYIWHCDADGKYSLYDLTTSNYLRGAGITDDKGMITFTTIFPGCYDGRWPHIHFEIFASAQKSANGADSLLTSQFAIPEDVCKVIYTDPRYPNGLTNLTATTLDKDGVFGDNTAEQKAAMTLKITGDATMGLAATAVVGVE
jgi:protocatechuate 3,4-dioxygenase beta subunit